MVLGRLWFVMVLLPLHLGARYHHVIQGLCDGTLYQDEEFELYGEDGNKFTLKGLFSICDGGYHLWRCLQFPQKFCGEVVLVHPLTMMHHTTISLYASFFIALAIAFRMWQLWRARMSKRMESVRKDVENLFSRIFKRFRLLRTRIAFDSPKKIDNCFKVACMLHNMLLREDKLSTVGSHASHWKRADVSIDTYRLAGFDVASVQQLEEEEEASLHYEGQRIMPQSTNLTSKFLSPLYCSLLVALGEAQVEREPGFFVLRRQLMTHYRVAYLKKEISWKKSAHELGLTFRSRLGSWRMQADEDTSSQDGELDGLGDDEHANANFDFEEVY